MSVDGVGFSLKEFTTTHLLETRIISSVEISVGAALVYAENTFRVAYIRMIVMTLF